MHEKKIKYHVGIDFDRVITKPPHSWDIFRRTTKLGLQLQLDVKKGLNSFVNDETHVGIYTKRIEWLRKRQTRRYLNKHDISMEIRYSSLSHMGKLVQLFEDTAIDSAAEILQPREELQRILLIDDSAGKIIAAAEKLQQNDRYRNMLAKFTLVAFSPQQIERTRGINFTPSGLHVATLNDWSENEEVFNFIKNYYASFASK